MKSEASHRIDRLLERVAVAPSLYEREWRAYLRLKYALHLDWTRWSQSIKQDIELLEKAVGL